MDANTQKNPGRCIAPGLIVVVATVNHACVFRMRKQMPKLIAAAAGLLNPGCWNNLLTVIETIIAQQFAKAR